MTCLRFFSSPFAIVSWHLHQKMFITWMSFCLSRSHYSQFSRNTDFVEVLSSNSGHMCPTQIACFTVKTSKHAISYNETMLCRYALRFLSSCRDWSLAILYDHFWCFTRKSLSKDKRDWSRRSEKVSVFGCLQTPATLRMIYNLSRTEHKVSVPKDMSVSYRLGWAFACLVLSTSVIFLTQSRLHITIIVIFVDSIHKPFTKDCCLSKQIFYVSRGLE